jgi:O-antigen/teichoic acid export membrane protein
VSEHQNDNKILSSDEVMSIALRRIARGSGLVFVGTLISLLLAFFNKIIVARGFTVSEYGVFNLALTVLSLLTLLALLGLPDSLPRQVAYYKEKDPSKLEGIISTSLIIIVISSAIFSLATFLFANKTSLLFKDPRLSYALRILAPSLFFSSLAATIIAVLRGFGRVKEKVYFRDMLSPFLWFLSLISIYLLRFPFTYVFWAYVIVQAVTMTFLLAEAEKLRILNFSLKYVNMRLVKEMISFSLPLLFTGIMGFIVTWTDTLMLGFYKGPKAVGIYNAAAPLARRLIPLFLNVAGFMFLPVFSELYAKNMLAEMKRVYQVTTRWIFIATLPIFGILLLFPHASIRFVFGSKYLSATTALQILSIGFIFHTLVGLNGLSLVSIGDTRFIMISSLATATLNIVLNVLLIPLYSVNGAAIATATSYIFGNILNSVRLYRRTGIHPFSITYLKPLAIAFVLLGLIKILKINAPNIWYAMLILLGFLLAYFPLVLITRSVDREDIELLIAIGRKLGVRVSFLEKSLRKFK